MDVTRSPTRWGSSLSSETLSIANLVVLSMLMMLSPPKAFAQTEPQSVLVEAGREQFGKYCASCHGQSGQGDGPAAGALKADPADLTKIAKRRGGQFPAGEIAKFIDGRTLVIAHGSREMPVWGEILSEEIYDKSVADQVTRGRITLILEYLKAIQR